MSKTHSHWEWSDDPEPDSDRAGVPEDAAEMGPAAIASFSGRVFDGSNEGVPMFGHLDAHSGEGVLVDAN